MTLDRWRGFPLRDACIYEVHVGTFTPEGSFAAMVPRLDHLQRLGVNAIELMPVAEFAGERGWGYDVVDLRALHAAYGTADELKRLIAAAHARGIAVVCDVVYNHVGSGADVARDFGPHYTSDRQSPWGPAVNFDGPHSDEARDFVVDNARMWLEDFGCDGLRLDAIHAIADSSATHILEEIGVQVGALEARLGRILWVIAESDLNDPRIVWARQRGGYGMDAQWSDDLHHSVHALLTGERTGYYRDFGTVADVATALRHAFVYQGQYSEYRRRRHGRSTEGLSGHRFLGYIQTHDQVGNRARGDRSSALLSAELLKVGAALVMTAPFIPMLFMGEEWGATTPFAYFTGHDSDLGRRVSEGRRRDFTAFGWDPAEILDPQDPATFAASKLNWDELDDPRHADLFEWHRRLIRLRRELPKLSDGRMDLVETEHSESPPWLVFRRRSATVACNFSGIEAEVPVPAGELVLCSSKDPAPQGPNLRLPPESVAIFVA